MHRELCDLAWMGGIQRRRRKPGFGDGCLEAGREQDQAGEQRGWEGTWFSLAGTDTSFLHVLDWGCAQLNLRERHLPQFTSSVSFSDPVGKSTCRLKFNFSQ